MATRNRNGRLEEALATLITSQATLASNQAQFVGQLARMDERFARIEAELKAHSAQFADLKAILVRHEHMLQALPEAVRDKIGFKNR